MNSINLWLEERARLWQENQGLLDRIAAESRGMNTEEDSAYQKRDARIDELTDLIERGRKQREREKQLLQNDSLPADADSSSVNHAAGDAKDKEARLFRDYLRQRPGAEQELRALQADSDIAGGYLVAPQTFVAEVIKTVDDNTVMASLGRVFTSDAAGIGAPSMEDDIEDASWTPEVGSVDEDTALDFGKRELIPHQCAKFIKVSRKLVRNAAIDIEAFVAERLGYKHGISAENAFLNGTGAQQPLGLFTTSAHGIPAGATYNISTGNTSSAITFDGLMEALYALKPQYQAAATWLFHRTVLKTIRKLKDGEGKYLWEPATVAGEPNRILGVPVVQSEYAPSTFTSGAYVGAIGDFRWYWIVRSLNVELQVLNELYARNSQVGYIGRLEVDGAPVLPAAFRRVTLA